MVLTLRMELILHMLHTLQPRLHGVGLATTVAMAIEHYTDASNRAIYQQKHDDEMNQWAASIFVPAQKSEHLPPFSQSPASSREIAVVTLEAGFV